MPKVHALHVIPSIPEELLPLKEVALNLRWAWDPDSIELFTRLDSDLWDRTGHNPILMLGTIDQQRLAEAAKSEGFLAHVDRVHRSLKDYLEKPTWFSKAHPEFAGLSIAYFSAEFGLTECLTGYAGGLGILAGDHLKSSSDLGLPLVGVGLLYQQGYFRQYLNADGWQQEIYPENDFYNLPIRQVEGSNGEETVIDIDFPGRKVWIKIWEVAVGRISLFLLDTNIPQNEGSDRNITDALYSGDREMRIQQEIVLGIGGMRALNHLKIHPAVCHMNEGHSAFLALERARMFMQKENVNYKEARQATCSGNLFTTHTPVPAGFDLFEPALVERYFAEYISLLGLDSSRFLAFGRNNPLDPNEPFNMAIVASKHSSFTNGVSHLHGEVTRRMVRHVWSGFPEHEIPVGHVTNGIHIPSFISREMHELFSRYLGAEWLAEPSEVDVWQRIDEVPDEELWRTHQRRKQRLVSYARQRLVSQLLRRGMADSEVNLAKSVLNSEWLTLGFARRYATYKRATLLLRDAERLKRILTHSERPVQILFAGKAHPQDNEGKELIRKIIHFAREDSVRRRVVFLEDYDISVARYLVQGVDVWLNTPRRPMEASGTSGMKVLPNGGLNLSILDGWWCEGYDPTTGWAIGSGEEYKDSGQQDEVESQALYDLLEREVVPLYYDRSPEGMPLGWIAKMRNSMKKLCPIFNTNRMVAEYTERFYLPAARRYQALTADSAARAKNLVQWRTRVYSKWDEVRIEKVETDRTGPIAVGAKLELNVLLRLGTLPPTDVSVQAYYGIMNAERRPELGSPQNLGLYQSLEEGLHQYRGSIAFPQSGQWGFSIRVVPFHSDAILPYEFPLITWEPD